MLKTESSLTWIETHAIANEAIKRFVLEQRRQRAVKRGNKINLSTGDAIPRLAGRNPDRLEERDE